MAVGDNVYEIRITLPTDEELEKSAVAKSSSSSSKSKTSESKGLTAKDAVGAAKKLVAYSGIKAIAGAYINHEINTISLRTGATEYEQTLQFVKGEVSQGISSVAAIGMGAAYGGVPGALVAAAGVAVSYVTKAIGWSNNAETIRMQDELESVSREMMRVRMGTAGSRSSKQ